MNYSSLVFRKDLSGVDEYIKWTAITSDLMKAYLEEPRKVIDGVSFIPYKGELLLEKNVLNAFQQFFAIYQNFLERGYNIERIDCKNDIYTIGAFESNHKNCEIITTKSSSDASSQCIEKFSMSDDLIVVEVFEHGSVVTDVENDVKYFYSNENIDFLRRFKEFPLELDIVAQINVGKLKNLSKLNIIDGLESNRMSSNFRKVSAYQKVLNQYRVGYVIGKEKYPTGRCKFIPQIWYNGKCMMGRYCDNEPEAICEAYVLEQSIAANDIKYLYNPLRNNVNHKDLLEQYVRGEISEEEFELQKLIDIADNPLLIMRYGLVDLCIQKGVMIQPFMLDDEGYMVGFNGERFCDRASKYLNRVASR